MRSFLCFAVLAISGAYSADINLMHPLSDEFIDFINKQNSTWTAGRNFDRNTPMSHIRSLVGALKSPKLESDIRTIPKDVDIPEFFDARENWPKCDSIKLIRDQSGCGSCWAVSTTSVMSDRICIHSNGEKQIYVSDEDLLSCCVSFFEGCSGGYVFDSFEYWRTDGLVSGGPYNSTTGCRAYSLQPCDHLLMECPEYDTPKCIKKCDAGSKLIYEDDKTFGISSYYIEDDVEQIQLELLKNGPVVASFEVYKDFLNYKSGVYQPLDGIDNADIGSHAVRVLGWGVENDVPYWLAANSWNEDWGDKGLFKIIRGGKVKFFEQGMVAGMPRL
uniref:Cathepsin B n=1 Tax=Colaphellus bowringi TaxID=561076 RepID=A0A9E9IYS2_9CUCU|nr:cathepsin B [Colaphellus bowringi]